MLGNTLTTTESPRRQPGFLLFHHFCFFLFKFGASAHTSCITSTGNPFRKRFHWRLRRRGLGGVVSLASHSSVCVCLFGGRGLGAGRREREGWGCFGGEKQHIKKFSCSGARVIVSAAAAGGRRGPDVWLSRYGSRAIEAYSLRC
ncbi:hypothetical protein P153DRAFT_62536 [Dothidotthia symphoricarpi CBS 119687]|uniref:Uncharacterized protein n=1 Tax=Dothidotthia symphoricarpi CBS 119687 TaxID=1392245 RepID=A0A6A6A7R8_9PLEO|nr:uncharacterized protein P153DRAFT_62536 [Dothidotthia symphoricarpi CBS 119687]KAF2127255.1 hypothetical protein P153DRAFT_62536 [Dothidotthia symphoricarpi CBS 119687]